MAEPETPSKLLLDVTEAAQLLGIGRSHTYNYVLRGELSSVLLGRRRKVPLEAVKQFVRKLQEEALSD